MVSLTYAVRVSCCPLNFVAEPIVIETGKVIDAGPAERPSPEVVMEDLQRLIVLRPTDPVTGALVGPPRSAQYAAYREALVDIADIYGGIGNFEEAMRDSGIRPEQEIAKAAPPAVPNPMAGPPAPATLQQFAQTMMGPGPLPAAAGAPQNAGPPGDVTRTRAGPRI